MNCKESARHRLQPLRLCHSKDELPKLKLYKNFTIFITWNSYLAQINDSLGRNLELLKSSQTLKIIQTRKIQNKVNVFLPSSWSLTYIQDSAWEDNLVNFELQSDKWCPLRRSTKNNESLNSFFFLLYKQTHSTRWNADRVSDYLLKSKFSTRNTTWPKLYFSHSIIIYYLFIKSLYNLKPSLIVSISNTKSSLSVVSYREYCAVGCTHGNGKF